MIARFLWECVAISCVHWRNPRTHPLNENRQPQEFSQCILSYRKSVTPS
jgi:hypothetical protein